jgi:hypothetical protein
MKTIKLPIGAFVSISGKQFTYLGDGSFAERDTNEILPAVLEGRVPSSDYKGNMEYVIFYGDIDIEKNYHRILWFLRQ